MIVAMSLRSPLQATKDKTNVVLPGMQLWSDITWLERVRHCELAGQDPRSLELIARQEITNAITYSVADEILTSHGQYLSAWPGLEIEVSTDDGQAMLGTPNGRTWQPKHGKSLSD